MRISDWSSDVCSSDLQASAGVHTVAAAAEELSASIEEIGRRASSSSTIAGQASDTARTTNVQVEGLASSAQKIGNVGSLIQDIAEQTNLMDLNATIQEATDGQAGKGFHLSLEARRVGKARGKK